MTRKRVAELGLVFALLAGCSNKAGSGPPGGLADNTQGGGSESGDADGGSDSGDASGGSDSGDASGGSTSSKAGNGSNSAGANKPAGDEPETIGTHSTKVAQVATGDSHTCALMMDGAVLCWGLQPTLPQTITRVPGIRSAIAVTAGTQHSCALLEDKTVLCWGFGGAVNAEDVATKQPEPVANLADVQKITAGNAHTCALLVGGTVTCWGDDSAGQLTGVKPEDCGAGRHLDCFHPAIQVPGLERIVDVAAGGTHTCALDEEGTVRCWGSDFYGEVSDQKDQTCPTGFEDACFEPRPPTVLKKVTDATQVDAGERNSCALRDSGAVRCWGANNGESKPQPGSSAADVFEVNDATAFATGGLNSCAIVKDTSVRCWGAINYNLPDDGAENDRALAALRDIKQIDAGGQHVCAVAGDGTLRCWGLGGQGQIDGQLPSGCTGLEDACFRGVTQVELK